MTLIQIVDILKKIALQQPNVRTATDGDIFDVLNGNPNVRYGVFHVNQTNHKEEDDIDTYGLNLFYVDRLTDDDENRLLIQSVGKSIIGNIVTTFCEEFDGEAPTITYTPFTQRFTDECAGVWCSVNISVTKEYACAEQYGEWLKPTVVVINNEDITIVKNGVYLPSAGFTGFGKVVVDLPGENVQEVAYLAVNAGDNGLLKPDNGYTAIREIEYSSKPLTNTSISIVENGNYTIENTNTEYQGLSKVDIEVNLPIEPVKQIDITSGGNYEVRPDNGIAIEGVDINVTLGKINPTDYGIRFGGSTFTALPDVFELPQRIEASKLELLFSDATKLTDISCFEGMTEIYWDGKFFTSMSVLHQTFQYCTSLADLTPLSNIRIVLTDDNFTSAYTTAKIQFNYAFQNTAVTDFSPLAHIYDNIAEDYFFEAGTQAFASTALKRFELDWDWSKCTNYYQGLGANTNIEYIQELDATNVTNGYLPLGLLHLTGSSTKANNLTYFGGFKNQKISCDSNYFLPKCPNLTRESCLAIVNNLYDFVGNSETPTSSQGKIKVHANFITALGDDINIAINKGWTVTS